MLQINNEYKIEKCLAKDWAKTSETQYIIKLDDTIQWSDGNKLTADDVIFTIQTIKNLNSIYYDNVKNIVDVNKVDENTIRIMLDQEIPFFEYNLIFPILSVKYFEGQDFVNTEKNNLVVGTGKYKIVENSADKIVLEKNENYKRGELIPEKITINKYANLGELYNAFKLGKVDLIATNNIGIENYIGTIGYNKTEINGREFDFLAINTQSDVLSNKEVRQAIARAINRENIVSQVFNNKYKVQDYFLDYGNWLQGEKADLSYNPDTAMSILQDNGWEYKYNRWQKVINYRTKRININLVVQSTNQTRLTIADMIKANLEEIGINVTIIKASDNQFTRYLTNKNYDMILTGVYNGYSPDLSYYFGKDNIANYNGFHSVSYVLGHGNKGLAAEIRSTANGRGNISGVEYSYNKVAGDLFTGTANVIVEHQSIGGDANGGDDKYTKVEASFSSRPTALQFYYKYGPYSSDSWSVHIELLDENKNIIIQNEKTSSEIMADWSAEPYIVELNYADDMIYAKCKYIYVIFKSTINEGADMPYREITQTFYVLENGVLNAKTYNPAYVGSVLTIDDISLVYDK